MATQVNVQAVERAFDILEALKDLDGAGVTELARETGLPKSTVHNHLTTLRDIDCVVHVEGEYRIALRPLELGEYTRNQRAIFHVGRPEVEALAEETGELANLLVEEHGRGVYLCRENGENAVRLDTYAGKRVYLHCTALGKCILAHLPEERVGEIIDRHGLPQRTERTVGTEDDLFEDLDRIRERGYAFDDEERLPGLRCVAAPILATDGRVLGAVSLTAPVSRMRGERYRETIPDRVKSAANVIEINMAYS